MQGKLTRAAVTLALAAGTSVAGGCIIVTDGSDAELRVVNQSDFVIEDLYITETQSPTWGPDLLGGDVLFPGESLYVAVSCDYYDILVVDETGLQCEIRDLELCFDDATWVLRNNSCDVFSVAAEARAAELPTAASADALASE
ncbi:MAG: hypothetical protein R2939_00430 [Kofleriaceae bacterium]